MAGWVYKSPSEDFYHSFISCNFLVFLISGNELTHFPYDNTKSAFIIPASHFYHQKYQYFSANTTQDNTNVLTSYKT